MKSVQWVQNGSLLYDRRQNFVIVVIIITAQCTLVQSAVLRSHVVRLSVCLSVTLVICDHIGWKSCKLIIGAISSTPSLLAAKGRSTYIRGTWGNFGDTRGGVGKIAFWRTKAAISPKRVKMEEKSLWKAYRNSPMLFQTVPSPTPSGLPFLEIGGLQLSYPLLSQEQVKLRTSNLAATFTGAI